MADARTIIDSAICNGIIKVGLIAGDEFGVNIMYKAMLVETIFEKKNTSTYVLEALKSSIKAKKHRKERRGTGLDLRWCFAGWRVVHAHPPLPVTSFMLVPGRR
jgi:hypothetical protein